MSYREYYDMLIKNIPEPKKEDFENPMDYIKSLRSYYDEIRMLEAMCDAQIEADGDTFKFKELMEEWDREEERHRWKRGYDN